MQVSAIVVGLLALSLGTVARRKTIKTNTALASNGPTPGQRGQVAALYTFGAPRVSRPPLTNLIADDGCIPGARVVTTARGTWSSGWVDWADPVVITKNHLASEAYEHPKIETAYLDDLGSLQSWDCDWVRDFSMVVWPDLHRTLVYNDRAAMYPQFSTYARLTHEVSYEDDIHSAAELVSAAQDGNHLVASAVLIHENESSNEPAHLIQNVDTQACILTFEGSDTDKDWDQNTQRTPTPFCGLPVVVPLGFKVAIMEMMSSDAYQNEVRPRLGQCSRVEVLGHSRGGAMATLFTACAHNTLQPTDGGFDEWQLFHWEQGEVQAMPPISS